MNSSLLTADRNTHLRIVAASLVTAIAIVAIGMNAPISNTASVSAHAQLDRAVVNAGPKSFTANDVSKIC